MARLFVLQPSPSKWKPPIPVYWCPSFGSDKLNVDSACKGNPRLSGGGGVVRNKEGVVLVAFSNFYGEGTNSIAELRALQNGLSLSVDLGLSDLVVNSDLVMTVRMVNQVKCNLWKG
ncbi:uncharacterized protein LOC122668617 [Telopea speciosissima]|uniref:uncharacterized protein LOC122668617 n=1 Tax=Telopea speciosissima TaxID=54955 RepID=UPI001CC71E23|nr:uncharacterized protein LOC122668617 [Telopea speciosissima]